MVNREKTKELMLTWDQDIRNMELYKRSIYPKLQVHLRSKTALVLHGVRRSGKTCLMYQLYQSCKNAVYINFEDDRIAGILIGDLDELYQLYLELFNPEQPIMFLDEVQNVKGWEKFVSRLEHKVKFVISGSNAGLLSSEYSTTLTGRHIPVRIHPLTFNEFLEYHGAASLNPYISEQKARLNALLDDYFHYGGFPDASIQKNVELLKSYFHSILYRDIVPRFSIQHVDALERLVRYLISNPGNSISYRNLAILTGLKHEETVKNYLSYIEKAYLFTTLYKFDYSLRKQNANTKKIYPVDTGFIRHLGQNPTTNSGRMLESAICQELLRRDQDVFYWKHDNGKEVDFMINQNGTPVECIQVCETLEDPKTLKREISGLEIAGKAFVGVKKTLITRNPLTESLPGGIQCISALRWFME